MDLSALRLVRWPARLSRRRILDIRPARILDDPRNLPAMPRSGAEAVNADIEQFRDAIAASGLTPPEVIDTDGQLHRFSTNGKGDDDAGWYVLHGDGIPAGAFGCWRSGTSETWRADIGRRLTPVEEAEHRRKVEAMRRERRAEEEKRRAEVESRAAIIWRTAQPVELHPYLAKKRVKAHGIRQYKSCLVIPLRNTAGLIRSLQFIDGEGRKRFLSGGAISGNYHSIGEFKGTLCIGEGYATCATVYQCTGHASAVAFYANNLKPVAISLRRKFPDAKIILTADNDRFTPGNPGVTKAREAALAVQGLLAVPRFDDIGPYDFYREGGHG